MILVNNTKLIKGDCVELIQQLPDNSVDCILTDPPYLYLKHKLDKPFDELALFSEWDRVVKDDGFIVFFGRGESFHRWNQELNDLGWKFKEEIVWKKSSSSPVTPIIRVHETVSILSKTGKINKVRTEHANVTPPETMIQEMKRLLPAMKEKSKDFAELYRYCTTYISNYTQERHQKFNITNSANKTKARPVMIAEGMLEGKREQDVMSVRKEPRSQVVHPTQKPVELLERILKLVTKEDDTVLDCFMGSGSTGVACSRLKLHFIGYEIDDEYFKMAQNRLVGANND